MSQENVEIALALHAASNRRDVSAFLELLDPKVEWIPITAALEGRVYRGPEAVRQWWEELEADWEFFEVHPEDYRDLGNRVLLLGHWRARGRASGIELENQAASWLYEIRDGKIVRMQTFTDRTEALAAARLR
jgi:ketosteroid isomerase-like protein